MGGSMISWDRKPGQFSEELRTWGFYSNPKKGPGGPVPEWSLGHQRPPPGSGLTQTGTPYHPPSWSKELQLGPWTCGYREGAMASHPGLWRDS